MTYTVRCHGVTTADDLKSGRYVSHVEITVEAADFEVSVNGDLMFRDGGRLIKAFARNVWITVL